jgi:hypothetical protein
MEPVASQIVQLLDLAVDGDLTPEALDERWPPAATSALLAELREDLLDAAEHVPGKWFTDRLDEPHWTGSDLWQQLVVDRVLLRHLDDVSQEILRSARERVMRDHQCADDILTIEAAVTRELFPHSNPDD